MTPVHMDITVITTGFACTCIADQMVEELRPTATPPYYLRLPPLINERARVVGRGCSGPKLLRHGVSDTRVGGACCEDSDVRAVRQCVLDGTPHHEHDVARLVVGDVAFGVPRVVHPQVDAQAAILCLTGNKPRQKNSSFSIFENSRNSKLNEKQQKSPE